jgi:MOSC domain-containing protein YiiM
MHQLIDEGYELAPGTIGENVLVRDLHVQKMAPGTLLQLGEVVARLEEPRQPCFVLDSIDRRLKADAVGRCGYMASIVRGGTLRPGAAIAILE